MAETSNDKENTRADNNTRNRPERPTKPPPQRPGARVISAPTKPAPKPPQITTRGITLGQHRARRATEVGDKIIQQSGTKKDDASEDFLKQQKALKSLIKEKSSGLEDLKNQKSNLVEFIENFNEIEEYGPGNDPEEQKFLADQLKILGELTKSISSAQNELKEFKKMLLDVNDKLSPDHDADSSRRNTY